MSCLLPRNSLSHQSADDAWQHVLPGMQRLTVYCLNPSCRHEGLIEVSKFPDDAEMPSFARKVVCAKCGARGRHIDVRPNWKEQPARSSLTGKNRSGVACGLAGR